ncbi:GNAT family N-acetyltransferase, partial [Enterococcus hirae]|uniref:GNAT family N-acetyltransferase n=1 Tax=Enterococcus hirae TaxID=1354 RepID=UPI0025553B2B
NHNLMQREWGVVFYQQPVMFYTLIGFGCAKKYGKKGFGRQLLSLAEQKAKKEGLLSSYLVAEMTALSFYQQQGYETCTDPFIEDGITCVGMQKELI